MSVQDSGALMGMIVCDVGTLGRETRGHDVAMVPWLLAEGCDIIMLVR